MCIRDRTLKAIRFGDNTTFIEALKAERYYYIGSEKNDHHIEGSICKMISLYAESVIVPIFYSGSTFCGKPIVYYSVNDLNQKQKLNEIKKRLIENENSLPQNGKILLNINIISHTECINLHEETLDKKQFEKLKFDPKKSILSLYPTVI